MLGIDRIRRELEVIARLDEMFRQKKDHSPSDLLRCQARYSRRQQLLEMLHKVDAKLNPLITFAGKKQDPLYKARGHQAVTHKGRVN